MNSKILRRLLGGAAALAVTVTFCGIERYMTVAATGEEPPYVKESYAIDFTNYNPTVAESWWGEAAGSWSFAQKVQWSKHDDGSVEQYKESDDNNSIWNRGPGLHLMNLNSTGAYQNEDAGVIQLTPGATYTIAMTFKFESWGSMWNAAGVAMYLGVGTDSNLPKDCYTGAGGWNGYQLNGAMLLEAFQGDVKDWVTKTYTVTVPDVAKGRLLLQVAPYLANDAGEITAHYTQTGGGSYTFTLKEVQIDRVCHHVNTQEVAAEASTCLKQGHGAYTLCSDCGEVTSGSKDPLPLADHTYGDLIPEVPAKHTQSELVPGTAAHYRCSVCQKLFDKDKAETTAEALVIPAPEHVYGDWQSDADNHWKACSCGLTADQAAHSGGTATCKDKAVCEICGTAYGETDSSNHTGETEVRNAVAATEEAAGYSGDVYCKDCDTLITRGHTINKLDHTHAMEKIAAKAASCTAAGNNEYYHCTKCGKYYKDAAGSTETTVEAETLAMTAHSGGTATCKDKAVCAVCGAAYGETDSSNHTGETEVRNAIAATEEAAGYSGDVYCKDCGVKLKNGESIPKLTPADPPETPATGEDTLPWTYAAILLLAGVSLMVAVAYDKRKALKRM